MPIGGAIKNVIILAMRNTMASTVTGPMDVFYQAGVMRHYFRDEALSPFFDVRVVTTTGAPFRCLNGMRVVPDGAMHAVREADLVLVSSILDIERTLEAQGEVVDWLKDRPGAVRFYWPSAPEATPRYLVHDVIVALETAYEPGMSGGRSHRVPVRMVALQALGVFRNPGVHIGETADGGAVHAQVIPVGAASQDQQPHAGHHNAFHRLHGSSPSILPSFK